MGMGLLKGGEGMGFEKVGAPEKQKVMLPEEQLEDEKEVEEERDDDGDGEHIGDMAPE